MKRPMKEREGRGELEYKQDEDISNLEKE